MYGELLLARKPAHRLWGGEIGMCGEREVEWVGRQRVRPESAVLDVALELVRVRLAGAVAAAVLVAPAGQRADARRALVVDDVVRIAAGIDRRAALVGEARQLDRKSTRLNSSH